ncbi:MAG: hypothetical protein J5676_05400 [Bacteroidaceae bacterium]|nr:hypothetical protein [Bacteroidaceae bacterium]
MDGLSTIASICSDKIEIRKVNSDMIGNRKDTSLVSVITDKDSVARVKNLITDLFIENNTPVILSKIDRDENLVIADYYPAAFSLYIPKTKTREFRLIAAYSYDRMRYVFSKEFVELIDMLNMRR